MHQISRVYAANTNTASESILMNPEDKSPNTLDGDTTPKESSGSVFDYRSALNRMNGDHELLATLLALGLKEIPSAVERLERALQDENSEKAKLYAHNIKGAAGTLGAIALAGVAAELQNLAANGQLSLVRANMASLRDEFLKFQTAASKTGT